MSRWQVKNTDFTVREHDYSAEFTCTNADTNGVVLLTLRQPKTGPVADLVGACQAVAQLMVRAAHASDEPETPTPPSARLN